MSRSAVVFVVEGVHIVVGGGGNGGGGGGESSGHV